MRVRLEEAYRLKDGRVLEPHWNEWFDYHKQSLIDYEEVDVGIINYRQWSLICDPEPISNWCEDQTPNIYWHDPDQHTCSRLVQVEKVEMVGDVLCVIDKDGCQYPVSECEHPELVRRIAEVDDPEVVRVSEYRYENKGDQFSFYDQDDREVATCVDEDLVNPIMEALKKRNREHTRKRLEYLTIVASIEANARKIFDISDDVEDVGVRAPWNDPGENAVNGCAVVYCMYGHIPDQFNYNLHKQWAELEAKVSAETGVNIFFECVNSEVTAAYLV